MPAESTPRPSGQRRRRVLAAVAEGAVAVGSAGALLLLTTTIQVDPMTRVGQVSGLAGIALRYTALGLLVLALAVAALHWRRGRFAALAGRLGCAAVAGLITGFVGGGTVVALDGTPWPLFANGGDAGQLVRWVEALQAGRPILASYPPLFVHLLSALSEISGSSPSSTLRTVQIIGTALFGPAVYLAWRLVGSPVWALAIGLTASLVLVDPYKPYGPLVLAVLVPVLVALLRLLRRSHQLDRRALIGLGAAFGVGLALLFLTYSGWFVWSAAGVVATALIVFPWRRGPVNGLVLVLATTVPFVVLTWRHLTELLGASGSVKDEYFYFDVYVDPAYIAMARGDLPGTPGPWPPPGELAGVGVFSLLLVLALGVAVWLAAHRTIVMTLGLLVASAWLMRFWLAAQMYETGTVQLWPRTTPQLLYCLLLLGGCAVHFGVERVRALPGVAGSPVASDEPPRRSRGVPRFGLVGALAAVLLLGLFAGSATADRYLPRNDGSTGMFAYVAHFVRLPDGRCPGRSPSDECPSTAVDAVRVLGEMRQRSGG